MLACLDVPSTIRIGLAACDGFFEPKEKAKYLEEDSLGHWVWKPCNPLKSHKTAKAFFGKAWRKTAEIWKGLEKSLETMARPRTAFCRTEAPHAALALSTAPMSGIAIGTSKRKQRSSSHSRAGAVIWLGPD